MQRMNQTGFLEKEEFAKKLTKLPMDAETYETGGVPMLVKDREVFVDGSDNHTLIFGATGSKKSRLFAFPTIGILARAGESFVVTDPKGELFARTSADVKAHGYQVETLNLRDFSKGSGWNVVGLIFQYYHNGRKAKAFELLNGICRMLLEDSIDERYWSDTAANVICGLFMYLFDHEKIENCTLSAIVELWMRYIENRRSFIKKIKEAYHPSDLCYQKWSVLDNCSDRTVGSIESIVNTALNRLQLNPDFLTYISKDELHMKELAEKKSAIYLIIPDENHTYDFVVSLFLRQYYEVLIDTAQKETANALPIRTNFIVDEFANLPRIDCMDSMITASRSRNIRFVLLVQSLSQLQQKYGDLTEMIISNCTNWIFLFSREVALLKMLQDLCGNVVFDNQATVPLCSIFDLQHMNKENGEALILAGRNDPCRSSLADIDEYPYPVGEMERTGAYGSAQEAKKKLFEGFGRETLPEHFDPHPLPEQLGPHPLPKRVNTGLSIESFACNIDDYIPNEYPVWLVAIGPQGMIMDERSVLFPDIYDGSAVIEMEKQLLKKYELRAFDLEFWWADITYAEEYQRYLADHPEKVYMTRDELKEYAGTDEFIEARGGRLLEADWIGRKDRSYEVSLILPPEDTKRFIPEKRESEISFDIPDYGGLLGEDFMLRSVSRVVNEKLLNTPYFAVPWRVYQNAGSNECYATKYIGKNAVKLNIRVKNVD